MMNPRRAVAVLGAAGVALAIAWAIAALRVESRQEHGSRPAASHPPAERERHFTLGLRAEDAEFLPLADLSALPADAPAPIDRMRAYAREKRLAVVHSESLGLDPLLIELLKLTPAQVEEVDRTLRSLLEGLRSAELAHAFVSAGANGDEEIVVGAFDGSSLIEQFRADLAREGTRELADFLADQLPFDGTLAVADAEIRVGIETGEDGADRVCFSRRLRRSEAVDDHTPVVMSGGIFGDLEVRFSATDFITTKGLLGRWTSPRLEHLFKAAPSLPRQPLLP